MHNDAYEGLSSTPKSLKAQGSTYEALDLDDLAVGHKLFDGPETNLNWGRSLFGKPEMTEEQKKQRQTSVNDQLDQSISSLASDTDKAALQKLDKGLVTGDQQAISTVVASTDPQKLGAYADELQKNLKSAGSDLQVKAMDGKLYVYEKGQDHALEFSPDGTTHVRKFDQSEQGTISVSQDPVLDPTVDQQMKHISNDVCSPPAHASIAMPSLWPFGGRTEPGRYPGYDNIQRLLENNNAQRF
jgi:hypothetical protein